MCSKKAPSAPPPPPAAVKLAAPRQAKGSDQAVAGDGKKRAAAVLDSTMKTSSLGAAGEAQTRKKTLLGQ